MLTFYKHKIIKNDGGIFAYNSATNRIFKVGNIIEKVLEQEGKTMDEALYSLGTILNKEQLESILSQLENIMILKSKNTEEKMKERVIDFSEDPTITCMTFLISQECNLRCSYCYGENGEYHDKGKMSFEVAKKAVDFIFQKSGEEKKISIIFFGGEPLLNFSLLKKIVNYIKKEKSDKQWGFSITTNGTLITPEIQKYFLENNFFVQISIDGDKPTTNHNRYNQNGEGSYDSIVNKTKGLREVNITAARGTITDYGLNLVHSFEHLYSLGFKGIALSPAYNMISTENYEIFKNSNADFIDKFEEYINQKEYVKCKSMKNLYSLFELLHSGNIKNAHCAAGQRACAVDIHGNIFPCHRFVGNKQYCIGNVMQNSFHVRIYMDEIKQKSEECTECWSKNICSGGCANENLLMTGHVNKPSKINCEIFKNKAEKMLKIYIGMTEDEKEALFG